jgi:hypothetical protein
MITVKGVPVSVKQSKKGKNIYMLALANNNIIFLITDKKYDLLRPVEVVVNSYVANDNKLYLIE